jgi:hypothetical protein
VQEVSVGGDDGARQDSLGGVFEDGQGHHHLQRGFRNVGDYALCAVRPVVIGRWFRREKGRCERSRGGRGRWCGRGFGGPLGGPLGGGRQLEFLHRR